MVPDSSVHKRKAILPSFPELINSCMNKPQTQIVLWTPTVINSLTLKSPMWSGITQAPDRPFLHLQSRYEPQKFHDSMPRTMVSLSKPPNITPTPSIVLNRNLETRPDADWAPKYSMMNSSGMKTPQPEHRVLATPSPVNMEKSQSEYITPETSPARMIRCQSEYITSKNSPVGIKKSSEEKTNDPLSAGKVRKLHSKLKTMPPKSSQQGERDDHGILSFTVKPTGPQNIDEQLLTRFPHHLNKGLSAKSNLSCSQCGFTKTPEWRSGPSGNRTLCNACGLFYSKLLRRWGREIANEKFSKRKQSGNPRDRRMLADD